MSSTRTAKTGGPLRQERYASSLEYQRGLLANLVAQRCALPESPSERELIWFIQARSHAEGGLQLLCRQLVEAYPDRIQTPSMQRFKVARGRQVRAEWVKAIRDELPYADSESFLLRGEFSAATIATLPAVPEGDSYLLEDRRIAEAAIHRNEIADAEAATRPASYPGDVFLDCCRNAADSGLLDYLTRLCLDPSMPIVGGPWYFPDLVSTLREYMTGQIAECRQRTVVTALGKQVYDTLDYALQSGCMVLIDGLARTGKTHSAKAWCEMHPGQARYVQVPSTNDEIGFFRSIAKSLGVAVNLNRKAIELRDRIEDVLQRGGLMLVLDEAHYLWPNLIDPRSLPSRVNWLMTALVNMGVPVALVTTPQFMRTQKLMEAKTRWASEQFTGRLGHYQKLPEKLSDQDLEAVSRSVLPEGDRRTIKMLVLYAKASAKYLAAIDTAARRARYLANQAGRAQIEEEDLRRAIVGSVIPSDAALAAAVAPRSGRARHVEHLAPTMGELEEPSPFALRSRPAAQPASDDDLEGVREVAQLLPQ